MRILFKFGYLVLFLMFFSCFKIANAQYNYSIDINKNKARRVPLNYAIKQFRETSKTNSELRKKKRDAVDVVLLVGSTKNVFKTVIFKERGMLEKLIFEISMMCAYFMSIYLDSMKIYLITILPKNPFLGVFRL